MTLRLAAIFGTLMSAALAPVAQAQTPPAPPPGCVTQNFVVPPGANSTDKAAPFYIDTTGLDFSTKPPTRDPKSANYPPAKELADGALPGADVNGNFIIGPTHNAAPDTLPKDGVARGTTKSFTLTSNESTIYNPGLIRDDVAGCNNSSVMNTTTAPGDKSNMVVTTSHPGVWSRNVEVYIPANYNGTELPFIVVGDGGSTAYKDLNTTLDNLIAQKRIPPMISIQVGNGGQDAQGSQRSREYDAVNGIYTDFIEREVLPLVEKNAGVKLTKNPDGRATMGLSSSGVAAFTMAWFRPDLYRRVLAFSPTFVNQQWPQNPALRGGAWEYHSAWTGAATPNLISKAGVLTPADPPGVPLIVASPKKPIRFWFFVGDKDLYYPNPTIPDGMHDWTLSNGLTAKVLADKGYDYQFLFMRNATHVDRPSIGQTLPLALEWLWKGYPNP